MRIILYMCFLPARLVDLDASQHRHRCFESLVSGTLIVGGETIEFGDLPLNGLLALAPCKVYPVGQPCSIDDRLITTMMVVVAFVESLNLGKAMI
jgi:hypothetical protein